MPPKSKKKQKARDDDIGFSYCKYCSSTEDNRGFKNHLKWCKEEFELKQARKRREATRRAHQGRAPRGSGKARSNSDAFNPSFDPPASPMQLDDCHTPPPDMRAETPPGPDAAPSLIIVPHPHDLGAETKTISLVDADDVAPLNQPGESAENRSRKMIDASRMPAKWIDAQLRGFSKSWAGSEPKLTLKTYSQYRRVLDLAQQLGVKFQAAHVEGLLWGESMRYDFVFRDAWEWLYDIVTDPALAKVMTWKSRRCFYAENGRRERFVDEPATADTWYNVDTELPKPNPYPHCWLPLHLWLDKGLVTKHVVMFPIVVRLLSLPSEIRNASGNGGGVIIGFMVIIKPPGDPKAWNDRQKYEFAQFKREIYQKVLAIIFKSLFRRSWTGETVRCGDEVARVLYPGFLINSMDMEEAWNFCCCRQNRAKHPCPRCLVSQALIDCLHYEHSRPDLRTKEKMKAVVADARAAPNAVQIRFSRTTHFMWNFRFSDPYQAVTYDLLHFAESGKWGHHLWPLTMQIIEEHGIDREFEDAMAQFPRWRGLKHIHDPLTRDFNDGQTHFDIFKCMVFVLVELIPKNSPLIPCLRTLLQMRMLAGLRKVTEKYGKVFAWPKQHFVVHMLQDILAKGVLRNATTRTGEGVHQEVAQHFMKTNGRDVDGQVAHRDEEQEAVARTRLAVDDFFKRLRGEARGTGDEEDDLRRESAQFRDGSTRKIPRSKLKPASTADNWVLGSTYRYGDSRSYEDLHEPNDPAYRDFDPRLRRFLRDAFPDEHVQYEDQIKIEIFRCLYIAYQSKDDWREGEDILRCNANWYNRGPRYDCVMFNSADEPLACARLRALRSSCLMTESTSEKESAPAMNEWRPTGDSEMSSESGLEIEELEGDNLVQSLEGMVRREVEVLERLSGYESVHGWAGITETSDRTVRRKKQKAKEKAAADEVSQDSNAAMAFKTFFGVQQRPRAAPGPTRASPSATPNASAMPQTAPSATYRQSPLPESASTSADPSPPPADVEIDGYASDITEDAADFFADDEEDAADEWYDDDLNNLPTPSPTPAACPLPIASTPLQPTVVSDSPPVRKRRRLAEPVLVTRARKAAAATAARQAALREVQGTLRSERRVLELAGGHEGLLAKRLRSVESTLRLILDGQKQGMMSASKIAALAHGFSATTGSRLVRSWTQSWVRDRAMPVSRRGQHSKVSSIFDDPAVCEAVRAYVRTNKWAMDPGKLKKLVNNELDPKTAKEYAKEITETEMPVGLREYVEKTLLPRLQLKRTGHGFSLATMRRVLVREGFTYTLHKKAVYYDGHERPDVVADRMERFIPAMEAIRPFITKYEVGNVDNEIRPNGPQHILCAHDEMTAQAHDGKKASWVFEGQQPLLKKGVGRGHHRSEFINSVDGHMAEAGVGLDYGKNHEGFWNGELFVKQVQEKFIPAFEQRHPGAVAVLLVDNSQGHSAYPKGRAPRVPDEFPGRRCTTEDARWMVP
ncbi:hypothetical protein MKEN_00148200 [Mycena kentingensis (nom. inval.)]|nr:hypothetical protein MKEN_00148200 [Mycena kentingensis (nom. inval.)]